MAIFKSRYPIGHTVYLKLRREEMPGMVTVVSFSETGPIYTVSWGDGSGESQHFSIELTDEFEPSFE